jgi:hypothetical protein
MLEFHVLCFLWNSNVYYNSPIYHSFFSVYAAISYLT